LLANQNKNLDLPVRSLFSAPQIDFGYFSSQNNVIVRQDNLQNNIDNFILDDIETYDQMKGKLERGQSSEEIETLIKNPFTNEVHSGYGKVKVRNQRSGETVIGPPVVKKIDNQYE
jgi:hypothetical protein